MQAGQLTDSGLPAHQSRPLQPVLQSRLSILKKNIQLDESAVRVHQLKNQKEVVKICTQYAQRGMSTSSLRSFHLHLHLHFFQRLQVL